MTAAITLREQFCLLLANKPTHSGDAIVFLCGEDTAPRLQVLKEVMGYGAATGRTPMVIVTGGLQTPPRRYSAEELRGDIMSCGVAYNKMVLEPTATNTREQALAVLPIAAHNHWSRLMLLTPSYHLYRAYLTFVQGLVELGLDRAIHLIAMPAKHTSWLEVPAGMDETRLGLLQQEFQKIEEYGATGHVASYDAGIDYLHWWEGK